MSEPKALPSQEELLDLFYYDDCLRWKMDNNQGRRKSKSGDKVTGCVTNGRYARINIYGVEYRLSRIVYQVVYGDLTPDLVIDHINRDKNDNRIENLRAVTLKENNRNKTKPSNNSTGVTGVSFNIQIRRNKNGTEVECPRYTASWYDVSGKLRLKCFSVSKLGRDKAFKMACEYRKMMIQSLIESGEWYDENHGK